MLVVEPMAGMFGHNHNACLTHTNKVFEDAFCFEAIVGGCVAGVGWCSAFQHFDAAD